MGRPVPWLSEDSGSLLFCCPVSKPVFEVRTRLNRGNYPNSEESVTKSKRTKVMKTAEFFIARNDLYDRNIVFEVIKVTHDAQGNILGVEIIPF